MPVRTSEATWRGGVNDGEGELRLGSGAWQGGYTYRSRFEADEPKKSNPEELLAAGHAGCFSLALANRLEREGCEPDRVETTADCYIEMDDEKGPTITRIHLDTRVSAEDVADERFQELARAAKVGCPVSRSLGDVDITLDASLV